MNKRSCLVQLVLFALAILVLAMLVKRTLSAPATVSGSKPSVLASLLTALRGGSASEGAAAPQAQSQAPVAAQGMAQAPGTPTLVATLALKSKAQPAAPAQAAAVGPVAAPTAFLAMPGLSLLLSRPLMFPVPRMRGLAAGPRFYYLSLYDTARRAGFVYQVDSRSLAITQMRILAAGTQNQPGGIHLGRDLLWVPLTGEPSDPNSTILGLDPVTLEARTTLAVPIRVVAVAEASNGLLYGFDDNSEWLLEWTQDGRELRRKSAEFLYAGYYDLEAVGGSLVCAGVNREGQGVLDVIDSGQLSLLRHYPTPARSVNGQLVTGRGFAYVDERFLFAPDDGERTHILSYGLQPGLKLPDFIPSVAP